MSFSKMSTSKRMFCSKSGVKDHMACALIVPVVPINYTVERLERSSIAYPARPRSTYSARCGDSTARSVVNHSPSICLHG